MFCDDIQDMKLKTILQSLMDLFLEQLGTVVFKMSVIIKRISSSNGSISSLFYKGSVRQIMLGKLS